METASVCYGALPPSRLTLCYTIHYDQVLRINSLVLIDHCQSLMLDKDGWCEDWTEADSTNAYLQLRGQLRTEMKRFMHILIVG